MTHLRLSSLLIVCALPALAQNYLQIDSPADGRSYTIDLDQYGSFKGLHPVSPPVAAAKLPAWLYPTPSSQPSDPQYDVASGIAIATFACGGTVQQVADYYAQVLGGHGLRVTTMPLPGRAGLSVNGGNGGAAAVTVNVRQGPASVLAHITYAPGHAEQSSFEVVWYDDRTGILRLRETNTGDEYEMPKRSIVENNLNRVGGVASTDARMPSWLPRYPGSAVSPKGRITWMFKPTAEFTTADPIPTVYEYYQRQIEAAGARITKKSLVKSGTPSTDFSAQIVAQLGDDQVEIHIGQVTAVFTGLNAAAANAPRRTGIGIRYTVPLR